MVIQKVSQPRLRPKYGFLVELGSGIVKTRFPWPCGKDKNELIGVAESRRWGRNTGGDKLALLARGRERELLYITNIGYPTPSSGAGFLEF